MLHLLLIAVLAAGDITGTVTDSASGAPIQGAEVTVQQGTSVIANAIADPFGHYRMHNIPNGTFTLAVHFIGYTSQSRSITVSSDGTVAVDFKLAIAPPALQTVQVTAASPVNVDTRTGDQTFTQNDAHYTPTQTTSQIVQQAIAGAARAPTGEVHIRGQHAEYTYYIDGLPVTSGVSGSLNELFDPEVVQRIDFMTGGWDASYGEKITAIINIQTKVPPGAFHAEESSYAGSFNSLGQSLTMSSNQGKLAWFASGTAQGTDMRREPVEALPGFAADNFSNHGDDYFGFTKFQYTPDDHNVVSLDGNYSMSYFQVPYDSSAGQSLHDHETDVNDFINLGWRHRFSGASNAERGIPNELFVGGFFRNGGLQYRPGSTDIPTFIFGQDTIPRNVFEDRKFSSVGTRIDYGFPVVPNLIDGGIGILTSRTWGHENFQLSATNPTIPNIGSNSGLSGDDFAAYVETSIRPAEWFELRTGLRFNSHVAPFAGNQEQWSPRVRLNFYPDAANTIFLYFGRLFMPTNVEDLRSITVNAAGAGSVTEGPTLPERDAFYEIAYVHRFPLGFVGKLDGYWKDATPGTDDNTIPGTAITTDINQHDAHVRGIEAVVSANPQGSPFSGYLNASIIHGYANGPVTGGFFILQQPTTTFDFDHDQRLSVSANVLYTFHSFYISTTGIYGSGLTNGLSPDTNSAQIGHPGQQNYQPGPGQYCAGLFCFNSAYKVHPSYIQQWDLGYMFVWGRGYIRPDFFVDNAWNAQYLLKGAFYSGQSVGRPRSFTGRITIGI